MLLPEQWIKKYFRKARASEILLVAVNLGPLAAVFSMGWKTFDVVFVYWLESLVIGIFSVLKLIKIGQSGQTPAMPALFFLVHYGMFTLGMFIAIVGCFGPAGFTQGIGGEPLQRATDYIFHERFFDFMMAATSFALSHGFSYRQNFIGKKEYLIKRYINEAVATPYLRLGLTIVVVFFAVVLLPKKQVSGRMCAVLLIALKTLTDLFAHRREHRISLSILPARR